MNSDLSIKLHEQFQIEIPNLINHCIRNLITHSTMDQIEGLLRSQIRTELYFEVHDRISELSLQTDFYDTNAKAQ